MDGRHLLSESDRLPAPDHPDDPVRRTQRRRGWTLVTTAEEDT